MMRRTRLVGFALAIVLSSAFARGDDPKSPATEAKPPIESGSTEAILKEALLSFRQGAFEKSIARYEDVLKADPHSGDAYAGIIRCHLRQDKLQEASDTIQRALQAAPGNPELKVAQGELLFRQGRIADSEKLFVDVINSGQQNARAYLGLARVSAAIAMYARAYKMTVRAHEIDPTDPEIQKRWVSTLPRAERIKFLDSYLAGPSADDEDTRRAMADYLEFLRMRQAAPRARCRLVSNLSSSETDLVALLSDAHHLRGFGLPVVINGKKSKLLLDTGAGGIVVNRKLAERAGIERLSQSHIGGIGDKPVAGGYVGYADSIRIGDLEFHDCPVEVMDRRSVAEEEGLIGADVFDDFLIDLDFVNWKMRLGPLPPRPGEPVVNRSLASEGEQDSEQDTDAAPKTSSDSGSSHNAGSANPPAPFVAASENKPSPPAAPRFFDRYIAPEMKSYSPVFRFGHMLLISTKINDVPGKLFLIDSGAFNNMITPSAAREVTKVRGSEDIVKGVQGRVEKVYETDTVVLEFGHLRQKMIDMVAFDLSHISRHTGTEISGTLGFAMLTVLDLKIDYRDALVDFEYTTDPRRR